jgi:acetyl-CoA synthetase
MSDPKHDAAIDSVLREDRVFAPPERFSADAFVPSRAHYQELYDRSLEDPDGFWSERAAQLRWMRPWDQVLDWTPPVAKWFVGGRLNVADNCLDRHLAGPRRNKAALVWIGEPGERVTLTYQQLHREVCKFANVLKSLGVAKGDRVGIYLPMIPEAAVAMLACARIGATHSVVFGGFSAEALRDRMNDAGAKVIVTADGGYRRGAIVPLKANVDAAVAETPSVGDVVVVRRTGEQVPMHSGRDHWWHELMRSAPAECPAEPLDSEHPLFILYTSGTTGKPKGVVHTTAGYLLHAMQSAQWVFDLKDEDTYWCTADIGWVTGHSYVVYGILANGATSVMYEGAPDYPDKDIWWELCDRYGVTLFYTAPTAIRACIKWGAKYPERHDLSKLRLLGTVGEPINPKAWLWYWKVIGGGRCPVVDTWWQTETGGIMITTLPGAQYAKPGSAGQPLPGIDAAVVDSDGKELTEEQDLLVLRRPWPGMLRTLYKDEDRFVETYFSRFGNETYLVGDAARKDSDDYFWIVGRVDDVINVSGHRLSTAEVESAIVAHGKVAEAAVVAQTDEDTGQAIVAYVTLEGDLDGSDEMVTELREHVARRIGKLARPRRIIWSGDLPKTRSGKIMRRLLRDIAEGRELGDVTTLRDPDIMEELKQKVAERGADEE